MSANIGDRLTNLRKEQQLTMDMLVEDINYKYNLSINKSMVSRWERNENDPSLDMAIVLCKYFNVSLDYLIGLTDVKTPARLLAYANRTSQTFDRPRIEFDPQLNTVLNEALTSRVNTRIPRLNHEDKR